MADPRDRNASEPAVRPAMCPFCHSTSFDTLAKAITVTTFWRCRACEGTWTIKSQQQAALPIARLRK
jgi:hypothetical protein